MTTASAVLDVAEIKPAAVPTTPRGDKSYKGLAKFIHGLIDGGTRDYKVICAAVDARYPAHGSPNHVVKYCKAYFRTLEKREERAKAEAAATAAKAKAAADKASQPTEAKPAKAAKSKASKSKSKSKGKSAKSPKADKSSKESKPAEPVASVTMAS